MAYRANARAKARQQRRRALAFARRHRTDLRADTYQRGTTHVAQVHLLQTDNNIVPVMGAVHMVRMAPNAHEKHFMHDVGADVNQGQRALVERSTNMFGATGPSLQLDRSAHVSYRNRQGVFEITVRRGVTQSELDMLISKLSMHRISTAATTVRLFKGRGGKRVFYGHLADMSLQELVRAVRDCLRSYGTCGIELVEPAAGSGALYNNAIHGSQFKGRARAGMGPMSRN